MAYPVKAVMTSKQDNTLQAAAEDTISPASAASDAQSTEATRKDTRTLDDYLKIQQRDMTAPNRARSTWNQMTYSAPGQGTDTDTGEANRSSLNRCAHCSGSTASGGWSCIKHVGCACHGAALIIGACGICTYQTCISCGTSMCGGCGREVPS